jgi:hypothetical protein
MYSIIYLFISLGVRCHLYRRLLFLFHKLLRGFVLPFLAAFPRPLYRSRSPHCCSLFLDVFHSDLVVYDFVFIEFWDQLGQP